ncbi:MAG: hypothetical protein ACRDSP_12215 [Pseudonocardiaceae bacterium]
MTGSITWSASFTITDARYVGAEVATDLRLLHNLYGRPTLAKITDFAEEVALLLKHGYLDIVDYGFRNIKDNSWKLRLRYRATTGGGLLNSRPGSFPRDLPLQDYAFYSYLSYSTKFLLLDSTDREQFKTTLPVQRGTADEPTACSGTTTGGHGYARNGAGVLRDVYVSTS